ncbi:unnamed protein product [Arabis nemorensis]|uniref:Uncharacterized protein n=1 Tax=Arabis nemorensis TaxID=586526 RepID=A0A565BSZ8_9BRAS|nr:unnamed protein product [Arabis nemorensis]
MVNVSKIQRNLRDNLNARRNGVQKPTRPNEYSGSRAKQNRSQQPGRGLIFGPVSGDSERSESGKRLRVEGKIGSVGEASVSMNQKHELGDGAYQKPVGENARGEPSLVEGEINKEKVMQHTSPAGVVDVMQA